MTALDGWVRPSPRARGRLHLGAGLRWVLVWLPTCAGIAVAAATRDPLGGVALGLGIAFFGFLQALWWPSLAFEAHRWRLDAQALRVRAGVWWRDDVAVPLGRVQHVDLRQGPLDRLFGLARVSIYTAAGQGADAEIVGIAKADAELLRERLVRAVVDDGV